MGRNARFCLLQPQVVPKLCALTLVAAALSRLDLLGLVWLLLFLLWGGTATGHGRKGASRAGWTAALAFSCLYLAAQAVIQALEHSLSSFPAAGSGTARWLGFSPAAKEGDYLRIFLAPGSVVAASALQLTAIRLQRQVPGRPPGGCASN